MARNKQTLLLLSSGTRVLFNQSLFIFFRLQVARGFKENLNHQIIFLLPVCELQIKGEKVIVLFIAVLNHPTHAVHSHSFLSFNDFIIIHDSLSSYVR